MYQLTPTPSVKKMIHEKRMIEPRLAIIICLKTVGGIRDIRCGIRDPLGEQQDREAQQGSGIEPRARTGLRGHAEVRAEAHNAHLKAERAGEPRRVGRDRALPEGHHHRHESRVTEVHCRVGEEADGKEAIEALKERLELLLVGHLLQPSSTMCWIEWQMGRKRVHG